MLRLGRNRPRHSGGSEPGSGGSRLDRFTTPVLLRAVMGAAALAIVLFTLAAVVGAGRAEQANDTVRAEAIYPANLAQQVSLDLAALDEIVVHGLLQPGTLGSGNYPDAYDNQRRAIEENLFEVSSMVSSDETAVQQLVNVSYPLAHFHALAGDSFAAARAGDEQAAARSYGEAHTVMQESLLPAAESFADTRLTAVGQDYDRRASSASSFNRLVWVSWLVLVGVLVVVQVLVAKRFKRNFNWALVAATVAAVLVGGYTVRQLDNASSHLASAHDRALGAVHTLGKARVTAAAAWQAEGQLLLDPDGTLVGTTAAEHEGFAVHADQLFQVPRPARGAGRNHATERVDRAMAGDVPDGATGHLANARRADVSEGGNQAAEAALTEFVRLLDADQGIRQLVDAGNLTGALVRYDEATAFEQMVAAIDEARSVDQAVFEHHARSAVDSASGVGLMAAIAAVLVAGFALGGLYQRLREYRT